MNIGHRFVGFLQDSFRRINRSRVTSMDSIDFPLLFPHFPQRCTVKVWLDSLLSVNFGRDVHVHVISLVHLKYTDGQQHEKVVIKLNVVPEDGRRAELSTWVTTERGAEIEDMHDSFASLPSPTTVCTSCAVHRLISASDIPAWDTVAVPAVPGRLTFEDHIANQLKRNHIVLCQITPTRIMTLAQLATLLNTIHDFSSNYTTLRYNCYWFAYTIGEVVRQEFGGMISRDENIRQRGLYGSIRLGNETSVEGVMAAYTEDWVNMEETLATVQRDHMEQEQVHQKLQLREQELLQERARGVQALQEQEQALLQEQEQALLQERARGAQALQEQEQALLQERARGAQALQEQEQVLLQERERSGRVERELLQERERSERELLRERELSERLKRELLAEHEMKLKDALQEVARLQALVVVPH